MWQAVHVPKCRSEEAAGLVEPDANRHTGGMRAFRLARCGP